MNVMIIGGVLFGTILGRYFKVLVLVPASALAIVLVVVSPTFADNSWWYSLLEICVLVTSLQVGYLFGLVTTTDSLLEGTPKSWAPRRSWAPRKSWARGGPAPVSRSYHIR